MKKLLNFSFVMRILCSTSFSAELPELQVPMEQMALTQQQAKPSPFTKLPADLIRHTATFTGSYDLAFVNKECLKAYLPIATQAYAHAIIHHQPVPEGVMAILRRAHQVLNNNAVDIAQQITEQRQQLTSKIIKQIINFSGGSVCKTSLPPFLCSAFESSLNVFGEYPAPVVLDILKGNNYVAKGCVDEIKIRIATKAPAYISLNVATQEGITEQHTHVFVNYKDMPNNIDLNNLFAAHQDLTLVIDFDNITNIPDFYGYDNINGLSIIPNSIQRIKITGAKLKVVRNAFLYGCISLTSLTLPNSLTTVKSSFLRRCTYINSLTLPNSLTTVGEWFLYNCFSLADVYVTQEVWGRISPQLSVHNQERLTQLIRIAE